MRNLILLCGVLASLLSALHAADPPAAAKLSVIRLGERKEQIVAQYGKPTATTTLDSGIESLAYQHGGIRLLVEISPTTKRVIQIFYFKATPFTGTQVAELLERNAEGSKWRPNLTTEAGLGYERVDGGIMRSRKLSDEYMLAFLTSSEVQGRHPDADVAREQEIKESLKEIE